MILRFRCNLLAGLLQNHVIVLVEIESFRERLGGMKGAVDEAFETVSFAILEIERPGIAVADRDDFGDAGCFEFCAYFSEVIERIGTEREVVDQYEAWIRRIGTTAHRNLMMCGWVLTQKGELNSIGPDGTPIGDVETEHVAIERRKAVEVPGG